MRPLPKCMIAGALALSASILVAADARADIAGGGTATGLAPWIGSAALDVRFDPECVDQTTPRQRHERTRTSRLAWLFGYDRGDQLERTHRPFAFYLRSPLLSGLYGCPPVNTGAKPPEPVDECAELTLTTEALEERTIQVVLPQYEAKNARRLRATLEDRLANGQNVTLILTGGEPYTIVPQDTRDITAKVCRRGIWNEP